MSIGTKYRLVTRNDFDGLVCAVLLKEIDLIDEISFADPKDMQDGNVAITGRDITTNLPYVENVYLAFDHHVSETLRVEPAQNQILDPNAPSASRVVYDHYGGENRFPAYTKEMMAAVDKADSGQFTLEEVLHPKGWVLLHFLLDPRTGLGRFRHFRISNEDLMVQMSDLHRSQRIEDILMLFDVYERSSRYFLLEENFREQIRKCATLRGDVIVLDMRDEDPVWAGNRFMVYAMYPECNISIQLIRLRGGGQVELGVGKSIFNRTSTYHIGQAMLAYGGGGHEDAGACRVPAAEAVYTLEKIIEEIAESG